MDDNGQYLPEPVVSTPVPSAIESMDISIDSLLYRGLRAIYGLMRAIEQDIGTGMPSRETVQNLKDTNTMLWEFKKKEQEFLSGLSDEELAKIK